MPNALKSLWLKLCAWDDKGDARIDQQWPKLGQARRKAKAVQWKVLFWFLAFAAIIWVILALVSGKWGIEL